MKQQKGFTLVELIVVIVILGILAATALPRFINVTTDANRAAMNGVAGALRSAAALAQSRFVASNMTAGTITMGLPGATQNVTVNASGFPTADAAGIVAAMQSTDGFTATHAAGVSTFVPANGPNTCAVTYTAATGVVSTLAVTQANCGG